jgi:hypothetical protein
MTTGEVGEQHSGQGQHRDRHDNGQDEQGRYLAKYPSSASILGAN